MIRVPLPSLSSLFFLELLLYSKVAAKTLRIARQIARQKGYEHGQVLQRTQG